MDVTLGIDLGSYLHVTLNLRLASELGINEDLNVYRESWLGLRRYGQQ